MPVALGLIDKLDDVPERIRLLVTATHGAFVLALKTTFKPTTTIPSIWLVLTSDALLLCNTHSTRGLWKRYYRHALPVIQLSRTSAGHAYLELHDPTGMLILTLPERLPFEEIERFLAQYKRPGTRGQP